MWHVVSSCVVKLLFRLRNKDDEEDSDAEDEELPLTAEEQQQQQQQMDKHAEACEKVRGHSSTLLG